MADAATTTATTDALFGADEPICPYTGLRTFTEEEAIYFRGRETHVARCLALLAEQHFVMVTGASGDGKSSLVFAGMLPEVRAGFVRARHSSWVVADFRPEREPLRNLARALTKALRLPSARSVETALEQGFSALVQLYQTSSLCPPEVLPEGLSPDEQRRQQRQAANLLLVVDQFEEFFTNAENYHDGAPNPAAQAVVNLLLETTRLAQAHNLPIYIVCTMRSDFVGQCAEFRGLIEQVGSSQYFVPRLLRHEFEEVIREPAVLSGNRISERLVQRLLYDIGHGQDQLPVLQHALRRIWLAADQGREEMDLLHYAMVGGLADELPAADQARFAAWRATLPDWQRAFLLGRPALRNVLDAHANQLYHEANERYNHDFTPPLPPGTAQRVIEQTFRVLTRTDGQRVVRNRLTGAQITAIINDPALPWPVVCRVLRPFRAEGTTFLSPFLPAGDDGSAVLPADAVLDITHESLIRNWDHLAEWARLEATDVRVANIFVDQANRWQASDESKRYLLPIGYYTVFAQWHTGKKGAASWLAWYLNDGTEQRDEATRQQQATERNNTLTRFLAASRRRLAVSLLVEKFGLKGLAVRALVVVLLGWVGWWAVHHRHGQSDYVAWSIIEECTQPEGMLESPYVEVKDKARFLLSTDRLQHVVYRPWLGGHPAADYAFPRMLDGLHNDTLALDIELAMYACADNMNYDSVECPNPAVPRILDDLRRRLEVANGRVALPIPAFRRQAVLTARAVMAYSYYLSYDTLRPGAPALRRTFARTRRVLLRQLREYARDELLDTAKLAPNPVDFAFCLHVLLGQGTDQPAELDFLKRLTPFGPDTACFNRFFPSSAQLNYRSGTTTHSGGYLMGAIVHAALRQPAAMRRCLDVMRRRADLTTDVNSGLALLPYLVKYELLTPRNTRGLLDTCAQVGGFSFNEMYAATVYGLLSTQPSPDVFDVSPGDDGQSLNKQALPHLEGFNPGYLNLDRVSFSLPPATRDKAWAALLESVDDVAKNETIFIESEEHDLANSVPEDYYDTRNRFFLQAFLAKLHGVYQAEIKHQPQAAATSFQAFSEALERLQKKLRHNPADASSMLRRNPHLINTLQWNLGLPQQLPPVTGTTRASLGPQDPIAFLRLPTRPKTMTFEGYYTCSFDAFFDYSFDHEASSRRPNMPVVEMLDSVAFVEAAFPDRFSNVRTHSLFAEALARSEQYLPNLAWISTIAHTNFPANRSRQELSHSLLQLQLTMRSPRLLQDSARTRRLAGQVRSFPKGSRYQLPIEMALFDLASAVAHVGRVAEAFSLADSLAEPMRTIIKIRAAEQAMLTNNQRPATTELLHNFFLLYYLAHTRVMELPLFGAIPVDRQQAVAGSVIPLYYWHSPNFDWMYWLYLRDARRAATNLSGEINTPEVNVANSLYAACKGYSLAGRPGEALEQIPPYESARFRQIDYNYILLGIAHRTTHHPADGWREYDEAELTLPSDYDGPAR